MRRRPLSKYIVGLSVVGAILVALLGTVIPIAIGETVASPDISVVFSEASSNDPGTTKDPGYDKNVACTEVSITGTKRLAVSVINAYPGYHPTVSYSITNNGDIQAEVTSIVIDNPHPSKVEVKISGMAEGCKLDAGASKDGSLEIRVLQSAEENNTYSFTVSIGF